ncbi:hypothetical protein L2089_15300 [Paenibacillus hunanensis]|uniref:hypothetical protein n=1 Tax=Paenibacillus hunanensis TaxID=539262 RepID=UPI00202605C9|nr:hypothetical protein [Paenibacillus hunanensis]MCL9662059.1 hypothetical protein [Paenibacillus hunanensis]
MNFKLYLLSEEFHSICDWRNYNMSSGKGRPMLILVITDEQYPDAVCCIPISKDNDKDDKYKKLADKRPTNVHFLGLNKYDDYLLIQNMFYVRKEFIGSAFTINDIPAEIKNEQTKSDIMKKVKKMDILLKTGKVNGFVPRKEVYDIQVQYLQNKSADLS